MAENVVNGVPYPTAFSSVASGGVPIGGIIPWMSPTVGSPQPTPPTGFEYCDGTAVSTIGSTMLGLTKPSLMRTVAAPAAAQRVIRGANTTVPYGGATAFAAGGADSHSHTVGVYPAGGHNHNQNLHYHGIPTGAQHQHYSSPAPIPMGSGQVGFPTGGQTISAYTAGFNGSDHNHTGLTTGAFADILSTPDHFHTTSPGMTSSLPAYQELAWIVRVL